MTRLALRISRLSELRCEEQVSESILEFSYSISLTDDILSAGHERTLVIRCHRSKRGQVFFEMGVADLYTETISMIGGVLFRFGVASVGGDL
jgi:hypothetical protein